MRLSVSLLALPAPLLTSLAYAPLRAGAAAAPNQRLNPLPAHVKYWPEDGDLHRRQLEKIQQRQQVSPHAPAGVRKMGIDEGEKFYMEYWEFGSSQLADRSDFETTLHEETKQTSSRELRSEEDEEEEEEEVAGYSNASIPIPHKPALLLHTDDQTSLNPHFKRDLPYYSSLFARSPRAAFAALRKRAFECPAGTKDCSSVGRATNCCGQGEVCQMLSNTGTDSDVGCCPEGQTCSGSLGKCDAGFTRCSDNIGGGCCIPLYVCVDQGSLLSDREAANMLMNRWTRPFSDVRRRRYANGHDKDRETVHFFENNELRRRNHSTAADLCIRVHSRLSIKLPLLPSLRRRRLLPYRSRMRLLHLPGLVVGLCYP
ncbi:MAG: hypothetical protein M4579_001716 [Chaenotheca gracillima]|nr:MAG: hypothetical protein M4579_001716 [Chaenotheca gracillima]